MKAYVATFSELPGYIIVLASDGNDARRLCRDWYETRFSRSLGSQCNHIDGVHTAWSRDQCAFHDLQELGVRGVAYWTPQGCVVLPPDIEAPGPAYRAPQPVQAYRFSGSREDGQTVIFASNNGDAWAFYRVWADLHGRKDERVFRVEELTPNVGILRSKRLMMAMDLGVTGVASKRLDGWDVLPPWDEAAGHN